MFIQVPATRDIYAGHYGNGVKEVVTPDRMMPGVTNGFGVSGFSGVGDVDCSGMSGWFDGVDWGSIIETGAKAGSTIAVAQWGQPNLNVGTSVQRVKNADGSYSEVISRQPEGVPVGFGLSTAGAAAGGIGIGTLAVLGLGAVVIFMMQGRR